MKTLSSLQRLRGAAALGVVAFHACQWSGLDFAVGAAGVDVFFLLSGFVLWLSAERSDPGPGAFLAARALRVAPLYWLVTLLWTAAAILWPRSLYMVHADGRDLLLSLAFLPHNDAAGGPFPLLPSGWTLTYEAFFYLVFAIALALPRGRRFQALALPLIAAPAIGFAYHAWYTLLANPLLWEFLAGVALARRWRDGRLAGVGGPLAGGAAIGAALAILALEHGLGVRSDIARPLLFGVPAFLILWGALKREGLRPPGAASRSLQQLGDASYALYLVHFPVVAGVALATPGWPAPARIALSVAAAIAAGLACHRWVERPLTGILRRAFAPAPRPMGAAA